MPRFAANLSLMYPERTLLDRFEAAARDGFEGVEFLFPYAGAPQEIAARLRGNGLQQVLFNAPPGGSDAAGIDAAWAAGQRGTRPRALAGWRCRARRRPRRRRWPRRRCRRAAR